MFGDTLPWARGFDPQSSWAAGDQAGLEGKEYIVWDETYSAFVRLRIVRNSAGIALEGKRLVTFKAGKLGTEVDGYARRPAAHCYPIDHTYTTTMPANSLMYIVVEGPTLILTGLAGDATNVFSADDFVMCLTGATSQATTAGRIGAGTFAITGNTAPTLVAEIFGQLGRALTARTTANTNSGTLVMMKGRW